MGNGTAIVRRVIATYGYAHPYSRVSQEHLMLLASMLRGNRLHGYTRRERQLCPGAAGPGPGPNIVSR